MNWTSKFNRSTWSLLYAVTCLTIFAVVLWFGASTNSVHAGADKASPEGGAIPGTGTGAIPDGGPGCGPFGTPLEISFDGSGLSGTITDVSVDMDITHTWVGDVRATLVAPDGTEHLLFSDTQSTTATGCGDSSDLGGFYTFNDGATGDWWAEALNGTGAYVMATGGYQTSSAGDVPGGGTVTDMSAAFGAANPTGTWTLRLEDGGGGDIGGVTAANLTVATSGGPMPMQKPNTDFDGDGTTDFNIVRDQTSTLRGNGSTEFFRAGSVREKMKLLSQMKREGRTTPEGTGPGTTNVWYITNSSDSSFTISGFGTATTDFIVPEDYDGDGKDDIAVWRGTSPTSAFFFILESSTSTVRTEAFGQEGDDPTVSGDYDGDGTADLAVFRCPPFGGGDGQCFFFYRGSDSNPGGDVTFVPWGFGETLDFFANPGDFDGDGKYDFCIQRENPGVPGQGQFVLLNSSDSSVQFIDWGGPNDFVIPGDYDGDGRSDFMIRRIATNPFQWYLLESDGGGTGASPIFWGIPGDEFAPGDYDGDGKQDIAIWRPDADPTMNFFYVRRSSDMMLQIFEWGSDQDVPASNWYVH